jgi:cyclopropane fatty-acyl-phospholipid synthase-like methyltransferase
MPYSNKTRNHRQKTNTRATKKRYLDKLKRLYPICKFDEARHDYSLYDGHKITYGEMEYTGIQKLYSYVSKNYNPKINCFMDIGSGRGKLCMYMAAQSKIHHVLGVELVKQRHDDAEILKSQLKKEYSNKVDLLNKNVLEIDFEKYHGSEVLVWFSNLCFEQSTTNDIFQKLQKELPKGTILCCSKQSSPMVGELLHAIPIEMSWNKTSNVFIYRL